MFVESKYFIFILFEGVRPSNFIKKLKTLGFQDYGFLSKYYNSEIGENMKFVKIFNARK